MLKHSMVIFITACSLDMIIYSRIVLIYYTFKNTSLITVCETHMFYISCKNAIIWYKLLL